MQPYHAGADLDALSLFTLCGRARAPRRIRHRTAGRAATSGNATAARGGISFCSGVGHGTSAQVRATTSRPDANRIGFRSELSKRVMIPNRKLNYRIAGIGFALCVILMCLASASGATLTEYRRRISDGVVAVQQLQLATLTGIRYANNPAKPPLLACARSCPRRKRSCSKDKRSWSTIPGSMTRWTNTKRAWAVTAVTKCLLILANVSWP